MIKPVARVFVFGTLKEGFPNFATNSGTRVPGTFVTLDRYPLYLVGERHTPWMLDTPGQGEYVIGQVFDVDAEALERMDVLEQVGEPDGYDRMQINVRSESAQIDTELPVHAYFKHPRNLAGARIMAGPFAEYTLEHAALYRRRTP